MTRNKVKLAWIVNDNARKSSFRKRKASLLKKMSEITTLCDVNAFIVVFGPDDDEPAVWPDSPMVEQLLAMYQSIPELERWKKMMNQEAYLKERVAKMQEQIRKTVKKNNELNTNDVLHQIIEKGKPLFAFEDNDLTGLVFSLEERMKDIRKRIDYFEQQDPNHPLPLGIPPQEGGDQSENLSRIGGDFPESLLWYKDLGKQMENIDGPSSSVRSDFGFPSDTYFGSITDANDRGLPNWTFGDNNYDGSDLGLGKQVDNFEGHSRSVRNEMGVPSEFFEDQEYAGSDSRSGKIYGNGTEWSYRNKVVGGGGSDKGLPQVNYGGITSGYEMGLGMFPNNGNNVASSSKSVRNFFGLNVMSYNGDTGLGNDSSRAGNDDGLLRHLPDQGNTGGGPRSHRERSPRLLGGNNGGSDAGLPLGLFGGSTTASDAGFPYDVSKSWQNPFSSP